MSVDPRLLAVDAGGGDAAGQGEAEQAGLGDDVYTVERIVDYAVCDLIELGTPLEDWENPETRYEVRYLVKWKDYDDPAANTWEPQRNFAPWENAYDDQIAEIRRKKPKKRSVKDLEKEAARKNEGWQEEKSKEEQKQMKKLTKGGLLQGKKKGKKVVKQEKGEVKSKGKKSKEPLRRISSDRGSGSPALSAAGSDDEDEDDAGMKIGLSGALAPAQPPPVGAGVAKGFAGSDEEDAMDVDGAHAHAHVARGFAEDSEDEADEEADQAEQKPAVAAAPAAQAVRGGFAADSDDDEDDDAGYFPALTPFPPSFSREPTSQPGPSTQRGGFAGSSDEEDGGNDSGFLERSRDSAAVRADLDAMPASAGISRSNSVDQRGFAGSGDEEQPAEGAQAQGGGFAGQSSDEDQAPTGPAAARPKGFANGSDDEEHRAAVSQQGGFAGAASDDEEVKPMLQDHVEPHNATEAAVAAVAPAQAAQPAPPGGGFAGSDDGEEEPPPPPPPAAPPQAQAHSASASTLESAEAHADPVRAAAAPSKQPAPAAATPPSSTRASPAKDLTASKQMSPPPVPRGPKAPHKRPSRDEDLPARGTSDKPPPAKKAKKTNGEKKSSIESVDNDRQAKKKKKKKKRVVDDDEEEDQPRASKAPLRQAQQIAKLKIRKTDPAGSKASPQGVSPVDQQRQSPSISADSSSLTGSSSAQKKQAKKALDPFNHGVAQAQSANGFITINGDVLRMKKLGQKLREAYNAGVPPQLVADVDQIRFMWSIGSAHGDALDGADDFDDLMLNSGQPRDVFITPPPHESRAGVDKRAKRHVFEYFALQLVLSSFPKVKQTDAPRDSVSVCFVHASELPELGRFPGKYAGMDRLRHRPDTVFWVYGMDEQSRRRAMRQIWRPLLSITFTPSALVRDAQRISDVVEQAGRRIASDLASREAFPWVPLQYFLPGGAFGVAVDAEGKRLPPQPEENLDRRTAKLALHSLLMIDRLAIAAIMPTTEPASSSQIFPRLPDRAPYNPSVWQQVAEFYPSSLCSLDLAQLQKHVCSWRSKYSQFRTWAIVATPDELKTCAPLPGITLIDVAKAEQLFQ